MVINDPSSSHLVRAHADHWSRLPSSTGAASVVPPLVLRGRCSALQDTRHLVSVAGCGSLSVAPHHATAILAHALVERKNRRNIKSARTLVELLSKSAGTCPKPFLVVMWAHRILSILSAQQRTAAQTKIVACVIEEVWKQKAVLTLAAFQDQISSRPSS